MYITWSKRKVNCRVNNKVKNVETNRPGVAVWFGEKPLLV